MAGHSQYSNIKIRKEAQDAKRAKIFSRLALIIYNAAKQGGTKIETNVQLRSAVEKAREANMPKDKIDKAISKASPDSKDKYEEVTYEFYGPGATAFVVKCLTDNRNRTVNTVKSILNNFNLSLSNPGSALYNFDSNLKPQFIVKLEPNLKHTVDEISNAFSELDDVLEVVNNAS